MEQLASIIIYIYQINWLVTSISTIVVFLNTFFNSTFHIFSLAGNISVYTPSQGTEEGKILWKDFIQSWKCRLTYGMKNVIAMPWYCHDHTLITAKHGHDHVMMTAWRPCFLAWSSWFMARSWYDYHIFHYSYHDHGTIIMFSMFFP